MALRRQTISPQQIQEEYQLIEEAKRNPRRFGALYERYYEQIFLFVCKRLDDEAATADLTSQVFLKAMLHLKKYKFKGVPFSAWLYRIAINEVNQYYREHKAKRSISLEKASLADMVEEVDDSCTEEGVQRMLKVLQLLSPAEVQMIELRFFEKMAFREIAEIYRITENNAKVRMYRLLAKMRKLMETPRVEVS